MILVALIVVAATAVGVLAERRSTRTEDIARLCLSAMLYVLLPFVAFVNFAHLELTVGAGVGLLGAWAGLGVAGLIAYLAGRAMGLSRPAHGALIISVIVVNTGYLGYPVVVALLGHGALAGAVAYDQVISTPLVFTVGFALGAAFGERAGGARVDASWRGRLRSLAMNPPLWAALAGLLGGPALAPHLLVSIGDAVVKPFLALGFFTVGVALSAEARADGQSIFQRPDRPALLAIALRFSVNPALLGLLAAGGLAIPDAYLLQSAMPTGINSLIIAFAYGLDRRLIATVIVWGTVAALLVATVAGLA